MTNFGKIKSYDGGKGTGMITPEKGGEALPFNKSGMKKEGHEPKLDQRYGYDVKHDDGGKSLAINLQPQTDADVRQQQASSQQG